MGAISEVEVYAQFAAEDLRIGKRCVRPGNIARVSRAPDGTDRATESSLSRAIEGALRDEIHHAANRVRIEVGCGRLDHFDTLNRIGTDGLKLKLARRTGRAGV